MRKMMIQTVSEMISKHSHSALILVDIGVWAFRDVLKKFPNRVKNIGIFEDGTVSIAAGLSISGITPVIYGISPFIVQRALEQLKLDFVYQKTGGNFITTGASYDFSSLGYSHYCPEDVATLRLLPGMQIIVPGTPKQFETLFKATCFNDHPTYFRMTDHCNKNDIDVEFGKATVVKKGTLATVITTAEMYDATIEACENIDVTILYYTTLAPFDGETLRNNFENSKVFITTPFYIGSLTADVMFALSEHAVQIHEVGVPLEVLRTYGKKSDKDMNLGLTAQNIHSQLMKFLGYWYTD